MTKELKTTRMQQLRALVAERSTPPKLRAMLPAAWASLRDEVAIGGDPAEATEELWDVVPWRGKLLALPKDAGMAEDCHMEWSGSEWLLVEEAAPLRAHEDSWARWWLRVEQYAARCSLDLSAVEPPPGAVRSWEQGRSSVWYAHHQLEVDLGRAERVMPTWDKAWSP